VLLAAAGADPAAELLTAAASCELTSAHDQAAAIDSRIHDINVVAAGGPLPWLPGIPDRIANDPTGDHTSDPIDLRPTGPLQLDNAARIFQQRLDQRLAAVDTHADLRWRQLLAREAPRATADPFLPELAERLTNLARAGFDATLLVRSAAAAGPLPDDHPAAALWWRILDQLPQTPNKDPAAANAAPATRQRTTPALDRQPPRPRSAPPPAFGSSR
jgi:hypothetical protein